MTAPFLVCATITAVNAFVSLGFSIAAVPRAEGQTRTLALYTCDAVGAEVMAFIHYWWEALIQTGNEPAIPAPCRDVWEQFKRFTRGLNLPDVDVGGVAH